jgi:flagellar FliL protein
MADDTQKGNKSGLVALVMLTLVAGGAGAGHGMMTFQNLASVTKASDASSDKASNPHGAASGDKSPAGSADPKQKPKLPSKLVTRDLPPLITNLQMPADMWVRLEGMLVFDQADVENPDVLSADITGDLIGYLRSLTLREIQGADGLMFLKQDLKERIVLRSEKKVRDFVIQSLVVQ